MPTNTTIYPNKIHYKFRRLLEEAIEDLDAGNSFDFQEGIKQMHELAVECEMWWEYYSKRIDR